MGGPILRDLGKNLKQKTSLLDDSKFAKTGILCPQGGSTMNIIVQERQRTKERILDAALNPIRLFLPTALIEQWCRELDYSWRERALGPVVTVLACVWQHMQPKVISARDVEDGIAEWCRDCGDITRSGSDFCKARGRLPLAVL
jgi:hypothetical protein